MSTYHAEQEESSSTSTVPISEQIVLILVGLIGSGKSTFAQALERYYPKFCRCSQDDLGDRRSVEGLARRSLREGLSVVIDRTNFDESQRATWINIAREFPPAQPWVIVFDIPYEICAARIAERTGHPTITSPELGLQVLQRFRSQYRSPSPNEGYTRILHLGPSDCPDKGYSEADVREIMLRLRDSPAVVPSGLLPEYRGFFRGSSPPLGGFRSRGRSWSSSRGTSYSRHSSHDISQTILPWARQDRASSSAFGTSGPYVHPAAARRSGYQAGEGNHDRREES
ncbi:AAA domain-containing protein [Trametes punicea]|nr:AAA domain-containing protein [Trametes punicea]